MHWNLEHLYLFSTFYRRLNKSHVWKSIFFIRNISFLHMRRNCKQSCRNVYVEHTGKTIEIEIFGRREKKRETKLRAEMMNTIYSLTSIIYFFKWNRDVFSECQRQFGNSKVMTHWKKFSQQTLSIFIKNNLLNGGFPHAEQSASRRCHWQNEIERERKKSNNSNDNF